MESLVGMGVGEHHHTIAYSVCEGEKTVLLYVPLLLWQVKRSLHCTELYNPIFLDDLLLRSLVNLLLPCPLSPLSSVPGLQCWTVVWAEHASFIGGSNE